MKRVYVNEEWCLGCRLCEYWCVWSASGESYFPFAFDGGDKPRRHAGRGYAQRHPLRRGLPPLRGPALHEGLHFGALYRDEFGAVRVDKNKCVGCHTCLAMCPYGCIVAGPDHAPIRKCQLCAGKDYEPQCVKHCPNNAIVWEEE